MPIRRRVHREQGTNNRFGFGSDNEMELAPNYLIIKHSAFPLKDVYTPHRK